MHRSSHASTNRVRATRTHDRAGAVRCLIAAAGAAAVVATFAGAVIGCSGGPTGDGDGNFVEPPSATPGGEVIETPGTPGATPGATTGGGDPVLTQRVVDALANRSFRELDPSIDADERKAAVLTFWAGTIELWAQYSEQQIALTSWRVVADSYSVAGEPDGSEVTLTFNDPRTSAELPTICENCLDLSGVSISVRNVFDPETIAFRVNDPNGVLRSPFPFLESWTRISEDEWVN